MVSPLMTLIIKKLNNIRLAVISAFLCGLFIWSAVPVALKIRGFISNEPMMSPVEITRIVEALYIVLLPLIALAFLYGVWFSYFSPKRFWGLVFEKFMFHACVYGLAMSSTAFYRSNFMQSSFNLSWEFIGFSVACLCIIFQWSFQSAKKDLRQTAKKL